MPELPGWPYLARAPFDSGHLLYLPVVASSLLLALFYLRRLYKEMFAHAA